jgi:hypothetical protein
MVVQLRVFYTPKVEEKIRYIVQTVNTEVGWFGVVEEDEENNYYIVDIYIPSQEVTGTTVEVVSTAVAELTERLINDGYDPSQLRYHGHSHVDMEVIPSITDQEMVDDYLEHMQYFVRGIYNKGGEGRVDVFDRRTNCVFNCVEHRVYYGDWDEKFYLDIDDEIMDAVVERKLLVKPKTKRAPLTDRDYDDLLQDPFGVKDGY